MLAKKYNYDNKICRKYYARLDHISINYRKKKYGKKKT